MLIVNVVSPAERDSGKDQTIVTLYVVVVISLLITAAMRDHFSVWWEVSGRASSELR